MLRLLHLPMFLFATTSPLLMHLRILSLALRLRLDAHQRGTPPALRRPLDLLLRLVPGRIVVNLIPNEWIQLVTTHVTSHLGAGRKTTPARRKMTEQKTY
jgi:hypothetical protein